MQEKSIPDGLDKNNNIIGADECIPPALAEQLALRREYVRAVIGATALAGVTFAAAGWITSRRVFQHAA